MNKSIRENIRCSGCGVCAAVCPKHAITFSIDSKGFSRPVVNESCIDCGLCIKKCHEHLPKNQNKPIAVYNCASKRSDVLRLSSSGGVFSELAALIIQNGGYVCGAALIDASMGIVEHRIISTLDEIELLRRSKYVESSLASVLHRCRKIVNSGQTLLFVGTPCQCSAIANYIGNSDNLILVDFICHGIASPEVLRWYLKEQEKKIGTIKELNFRDKRNQSSSYFTIKGENGDICIENYTNGYPFMFSSSLIMADDCITCKYTTLARCSDITLADKCDGTGMDFDKSTVLANTVKGNQLLSALDIDKTQIDINTVVAHAWHLTKVSTLNPLRESFFKEYKNLPYDMVYKKYMILHTPSILQRVLNKLKNIFNK